MVGASVLGSGVLAPTKSWKFVFGGGFGLRGHSSCTGEVRMIMVVSQSGLNFVVVIPYLGCWIGVIAWMGIMIIAGVIY